MQPLDPKALRAIDRSLDDHAITSAQQMLAKLGQRDQHGVAIDYLVTRLLYLRNRLTPAEVSDRLRALLKECPDFCEAKDLLKVARAGVRGCESTQALKSMRFAAHAPRTLDAPWLAEPETNVEPSPVPTGRRSLTTPSRSSRSPGAGGPPAADNNANDSGSEVVAARGPEVQG